MKKVKRFKNSLFILGLVLILTISTFAMSQTYADDTSMSAVALSQKPYVSSKLGISIQYPKNWTIDVSGKYGAELFFFSDVTDKEKNKPFTSNINITTEDTQGYGLKAYIDASKKYIKKSFAGYKSLPDRKVTVNGKEAYIISGIFSQKGYNIRNEQLILVSGGKAYIVTATSLASTWTKYKDLFNSSFMTLKIVK